MSVSRRRYKKQSSGLGVLGKTLSVLLAINLAVMFALPVGIFADDIVVAGEDATAESEVIDKASEENKNQAQGGEESTSTQPDVAKTEDDSSENDADKQDKKADESQEANEAEKSNEAMETDEANKATVQPFGGPIPGVPGGVTVDTWAELQAAILDTSVSRIELTQNITKPATPTGAATYLMSSASNVINRTLVVDGKGFTLDFRNGGTGNTTNNDGNAFQLSAAAAGATTFTLQNIVINRNGATDTPVIVAYGAGPETNGSTTIGNNWTINLENVTSADAPTAGLVYAPDAHLVVKGIVTWENRVTIDATDLDYEVINVRDQLYTGEDTIVRLASDDQVLRAQVRNRDNIINVTDGAEVYIYSPADTNAIQMEESDSTSYSTTCWVKADGVGSLLDVRGVPMGDVQGVLFMRAPDNQGGFEFTNGAHVNIVAEAPATASTIWMYVEGSQMIIDGEGTVVNFENTQPWSGYGAVMRIYLVGNQQIIVRNKGEFNVTKHRHTSGDRAAAIRFGTGENNSFTVETGGSVNIHNEGNGNAATSPSALYANAAIEFDNRDFRFIVKDEGSNINLISDFGAVVAAGGERDGLIDMGVGTTFVARGNMNSTSQGIFTAGYGFDFVCDRPLYYDFTNTNPTVGARVFGIQSSGTGNDQSRFTGAATDIAVWGNGTSRVGGTANATNSTNNPVDGNPYKSWTLVGYSLAGPNFNTLTSTDDPDYFNTGVDNFGTQGMNSYRRISGNNAQARILTAEPATNADRFIRWTGVVAEGVKSDDRPIWTDEVFARIQITESGQTRSSIAGEVTSINPDELYTVQTGVTELDGVVRYDNEELLKTGDSYSMTQLWRGEYDDPASPRVHVSSDSNIIKDTITVQDALPPVPAVVSTPATGKMWAGITKEVTGTYSLADAQAAAEPHNPDPAKTLIAVRTNSGGVVQERIEEGGDLKADGTWTFIFEDVSGFQEGDKVYFVLQDGATPVNENPLVDTAFHDTTKKAAPYLSVSLPDLIPESTPAEIGLDEAYRLAGLSSNQLYTDLQDKIDANFVKRAGSDTTLPEGATVNGVNPTAPKPGESGWGDASIFGSTDYTENNRIREDFRAEYPNGKEYTVNFYATGDPTIVSSETITVLPFATPYIDASDFSVAPKVADEMMGEDDATRDAWLIEKAKATARLDLNDDWSSDNVIVTDIGIVTPAVPGAEYTVEFAVIGKAGQPYFTTQITVKIDVDPDIPMIIAEPAKLWIDDTEMPTGYIKASDYEESKIYNTAGEKGGDLFYLVRAWNHAGAGATELSSSVEFVSTTLPQNPRYGIYSSTYTVINSDRESITATRAIIVGPVGDVLGYNFVATSDEVTAANTAEKKDTLIREATFAQAWQMDVEDGLVEVPTNDIIVNGRDNLLNTPTAEDATYKNMSLSYEPEDVTAVVTPLPIETKVYDRDLIARGTDVSNDKYAVLANDNISRTDLAANGHGNDNAWLIAQAQAEGFKFSLNSTAPGTLGTTEDVKAQVISNDMASMPNPIPRAEPYKVVFAPVGDTEVTVTVNFYITVGNTAPTITFPSEDSAPLVIKQTPGVPHMLTAEEIKANMMVIDAQENMMTPGGYPDEKTTFSINGGSFGLTNNVIDTQNIGVYKVEYRATDTGTPALSGTATRAIVVTDGREVIEKGDPANPTDGVILMAKDFVMLQSEVEGTRAEVDRESAATAYLEDGTSSVEGVPVTATISNFTQSGWIANAAEGEYFFDYVVSGRATVDGKEVKKTIKGIVTSGDVIYKAGPNDQYSIVANHFDRLISEADLMRDNLYPKMIEAANARVYKVVSSAPDARISIKSTAFPGSAAAPAVVGDYPTTYGAQKLEAGSWVNVVSTPRATEVTARASVIIGKKPQLWATSPLEINLGSPFDRNMGITLTDEDDPGLTVDQATLTGTVDSTTPGLYALQYSYTDPEGNTTQYASEDGQRVVVVNDGHYGVSSTAATASTLPQDLNGRILYATSFVIKKVDIATDATAQILNLSKANGYNGKTSNPLGETSINVASGHTYGASANAGTYPITLQLQDVSGVGTWSPALADSGYVTKGINAVVVDAATIVSDGSNNGPKEFGDTTYIYGQNLPTEQSMPGISRSDAEAIANSGLNSADGVKGALKIGAVKTLADGSIETPAVTITDTDNFITAYQDTDPTNDLKAFRFEVSAEGTNKTQTFTIRVEDEPANATINALPKPLLVNLPVADGEKDASDNLTAAKIKEGVVVIDQKEISASNPTGDMSLSDRVTYEVFDEYGKKINSNTISAIDEGFYKVVYTYTDRDLSTVSDSRGVVVGGDPIIRDGYILNAKSFIINKTKVASGTNITAQLREMTEAKAWTIEGDAVAVSFNSTYSNIVTGNDYSVEVIYGPAATDRYTVFAKVVEDQTLNNTPNTMIGDGNSDNGNRYSIYARNFRINHVDANTLRAQVGTDEYKNTFKDMANATSYSRLNNVAGLALAGNAEYVSDTGFATSGELEEGQSFDVVFRVSEDHEATITVKVFVNDGNDPVLTLPADKSYPLGYDFTEAEYLVGVSATDVEDDNAAPPIPVDIQADLSQVNINKIGAYVVPVTATDSDHNAVTKNGVVWIGIDPVNGYGITAFNVVATQTEMASGNVANLIADAAFAKILYANGKDDGSYEILELSPVITQDPSDSTIYNITAAPAIIGETVPVHPVKVTVVNQDESARMLSAGGDKAYTIVANNIVRGDKTYVGYGDETNAAVKAFLIGDTNAKAYEMTLAAPHINAGATTYNLGNTNDQYAVDIANSTLVDNPVPTKPYADPDPYKITFKPLNVDLLLEIDVAIASDNRDPMIAWQDGGYPLVIKQTPGVSHMLTADEIKAKMTVTDDNDVMMTASGYPNDNTVFSINDGSLGLTNTTIDTQNIGVYNVRYVATDSAGLFAEATRAIVVTDGREVIDMGDPTDNTDGLILMARDFAMLQQDVRGSKDEILNNSSAEAYYESGKRVADSDVDVEAQDLVIWKAGIDVNEDPGYPFTITVTGKTATKEIYGKVFGGKYIYPGGKDDQYAIVGDDFSRTISEADTMRALGDGRFAVEIELANVKVIKLVDAAPDGRAYVVNDNNYPGPEPTVARQMDVTYGIQRFNADTNTWTVVVTKEPSEITGLGKVIGGVEPTLTVTSPVNVELNEAFNLTDGVTIEDPEDMPSATDVVLDIGQGDANPTLGVATNPVDTSVAGIYPLKYYYVDMDGNTTGIVNRTVVVNDGHYITDPNDPDPDPNQGRILYGNSFVVGISDVATTAAYIKTQILSMSEANVYDGKTGEQLGSMYVRPIVDAQNPYQAGVGAGDYPITLQADDVPIGLLEKQITAIVIGAPIIISDDDDGEGPKETGDTTYVYGQNLQLELGDAVDLASQGNAAVKEAMLLGALKVLADGTKQNITYTESGIDAFIAAMTDTDDTNDIATFDITVSDEALKVTKVFTISVASVLPHADNVFSAIPNPLRIDFPVAANLKDADGNLTSAKIMEGVTAIDGKEKDNPTYPNGNVLSEVTYEIYDENGVRVSGDKIATVEDALYTVNYKYTDRDKNLIQWKRTIIIGDDYITDGEYIIKAKSFIINSSNVDVSASGKDAQLRAMTEAKGWRVTGEVVSVGVSSTYTNAVNDYNVTITANTFSHSVKARVINDKTGSAPASMNMSDGNSDNGIDYSIYAHNFRINETHANELIQKAGSAEYATEFINRAGAQSYSRTLGLAIAGTPEFVSDGGFATSGALTESDQSFNVTFKVSQDSEAAVVIKVWVNNGNPPTLTVPETKGFELGYNITNADYMLGVSASDVEDNAANRPLVVTYDASAVNINKRGIYEVPYSVTDSDFNTVTMSGFIGIDINGYGNYFIDAMDFVTTTKDVQNASDLNMLILEKSRTEVTEIITDADGKRTTQVNNALREVKDRASFSSINKDYPGIVVGVQGVDKPTETISGKVIDKDIINNTPKQDPDGTQVSPPDGNDKNLDDSNDQHRYIVAVKNATIRVADIAGYVGDSSTVKQNLINKAAAESFRILTSTENWDVDVSSNPILANAKNGESYYVTFIAKNVPSVWVKAKFTITISDPPTITVNGPLEVAATEASTLLTKNNLINGVTAQDDINGNITGSVNVIDDNGTLPAIDSSKPGLYPISYTVVDDDGNTAEAVRTVIVNDGRYIPVDIDDDGKIDVVIGAKNFVVQQNEVVPTQNDIRIRSWAEAYKVDGSKGENLNLTSQLMLRGGIPAAYAANPAVAGAHTFTWTIRGYEKAVKTITGTVIPNNYIVDPNANDKDAKYALIAKNSSSTISEAAAIAQSNRDSDYIKLADVKVITLVGNVTQQPTTTNTDGFGGTQGRYDLTFGIKNPTTASLARISVGTVATVTGGNAPVLSSDDTIVFPNLASSGRYNAEQIKAQGKVVATDAEEGNITNKVRVLDPNTNAALSVPATEIGGYQALLSVTDKDGNTVEKRVGIFVGITPGAYGALSANNFTIDTDDVSVSMAREQILKESNAKAWNRLGQEVAVQVITDGGYTNTRGTYRPVLGVYAVSAMSASALEAKATGDLSALSVSGINTLAIGDPLMQKTIVASVTDDTIKYVVHFSANGGVLSGGIDRIVVTWPGTLPYMPPEPKRDGYTFLEWNTKRDGKGTEVTTTTPITRNMTLYAQWAEDKQAPPAVVVPPADAPNNTTVYDPADVTVNPPDVIVNQPDVNVYPQNPGTNVVTVTPEMPESAPINVNVEVPEQQVITTPIQDTETPLDDGSNEPTTWSLINLIAAILSLLLLLIFAIKMLFDRPKDEQYDEEPVDAEFLATITPQQREQYQRRREADYQTWLTDQQRIRSKNKALFVNAPVLLIVGLAFVEALILLFTTQNFYEPMVIVDGWTVVFSLVVFVQLLTPMVAAVIYNSKQEARKQDLFRKESASKARSEIIL